MYFIVYLRRRDPTEFTGVETYVWSRLQEQDMSWIPARTSFAIQNYGVTVEDDEEDATGKMMEQMMEQMEDLTKEVSGISTRLQSLEKTSAVFGSDA